MHWYIRTYMPDVRFRHIFIYMFVDTFGGMGMAELNTCFYFDMCLL